MVRRGGPAAVRPEQARTELRGAGGTGQMFLDRGWEVREFIKIHNQTAVGRFRSDLQLEVWGALELFRGIEIYECAGTG